jgi:hypothetical protein
MRPTGFDSNDLRRSRSGSALSKARKRRVEAVAAIHCGDGGFRTSQSACEKSGLKTGGPGVEFPPHCSGERLIIGRDSV